MKRSEMIKHLEKFSEQWTPDTFEPSPEDYWDDLLSALETLGMKPPERTYWNRKKDGSLMPSPKNGEIVNTWEPEES